MVSISINGKAIDDIELFVFDKDGTIIDLYCYWSKMAEFRALEVCQTLDLSFDDLKEDLLDAMGIDVNKGQIKPTGPIGLKTRVDVQGEVEKFLSTIDVHGVESKCEQAFLNADERSNQYLNDMIKPLDGAIDLLKELKERNVRLAIATSDKTKRAEIIMDILGIKDLFDVIVGFDRVQNHKPAPDSLEYINRSLDISFDRSVMIGDFYADIEMALNAGYKAAIAIKNYIIDEDKLRKLTPYIIERFDGIKLGQNV